MVDRIAEIRARSRKALDYELVAPRNLGANGANGWDSGAAFIASDVEFLLSRLAEKTAEAEALDRECERVYHRFGLVMDRQRIFEAASRAALSVSPEPKETNND